MFPDEFQEGIEKFIEYKLLHRVFNFVCQYVRRLYSDNFITKALKMTPGYCFFQFVSPSDIAYVISVIKNGKEMWDQEIRLAENQDMGEDEPTKKARPLFTSGMGKKRSFGVSLWNKEGLNYYHTAEENWKTLYNSVELFSKVCNEWERWEPKEKGKRKQALKTWWKDKEAKLTYDEKDDDETWYDKGGYTADLGEMGVWKYDEDIGVKGVAGDDHDEDKGDGVVMETGEGGGEEGDSSANAKTVEQRKSGRGGDKNTK